MTGEKWGTWIARLFLVPFDVCVHICSVSFSVCMCVGRQALTGVVLNTDNQADVL